MRTLPRNPRTARAAIALLAGLLVGGWVGGGLVWILNRSKLKDPNTVSDVALTRADEVEMVPADAMGFAHVRLADMWRTEAMAEFRKVLEKAGPEALKAIDEGFVPAPSSVDRATVVVIRGAPTQELPPLIAGPTIPKGPPSKGGAVTPPVPPPPPLPKAGGPPPAVKPVELSPTVFAILAFSAPFDAAKVRETGFPRAVEESAGGKPIWYDSSIGVAVHFPSDRLMVIGTGSAVSKYLSKPPAKEGALAPAIKLAAGGSRHLVAAVNMMQIHGFQDFPNGLPDEISPILRAESMTFGLVVGSGAKFDLRAAYKDDATAQEAEKSLRAAAETGRKKLATMKIEMEASVNGKAGAAKPRPIKELPEAIGGLFGLGAINMLDEWLADPPLKREGSELSVTLTANSMGSSYVALSAMSVGMLLPAVQKVREAAARSMDSNNLKQLALAMHNYHDANGKMPSSSWGTKFENGRQTGKLSWRVALLPYIEQGALYQQFKTDEPWDSENNKKLIPLMPKTFANPRAIAQPGMTYYKIFVGGGAAFDHQRDTKMPASFPDGTTNTILIAEGGEPVIWTKPDDFEFNPKEALPKLALPGVNGINVAMADGSTRFVDLTRVSEKTLKQVIQADDGEPLGSNWNDPKDGPFPMMTIPKAPNPKAPMPKFGPPPGKLP